MPINGVCTECGGALGFWIFHEVCKECAACSSCDIKDAQLIHYRSGLLCKECDTKRINKLLETFEGNTDYTSEIACPYCGYEYSDSWEMNDSGEIECRQCCNEFEFERDVSVTYRATKVKPAVFLNVVKEQG